MPRGNSGAVAKMWLYLVFLLLSFDLTTEEIHRARGIKPPKLANRKFTPRSTWPPGPNTDDYPPAPVNEEGEYVRDNDNYLKTSEKNTIERHSKEAWIYSIISSCLVGLSGIFPLLVIPLEAGEALKHGAAAAQLKLLLSFAAGGLLGDVFLHLLPEAWQSLQAGDHSGHTTVGLWVMVGMLVFLFIEKMFPDDEESTEPNEENEMNPESQSQQNHSDEPYQNTEPNLRHRTQTSHKQDQSSTTCNGDAISNNTYTEKGEPVERNFQNNVCHSSESEGQLKKSSAISNQKSGQEEKSRIKISGWLNLMANVVDNFTHGLAVAGSYCVSTKVGVLTTFAILLHEVPHEVGDFAILLRAGFDRWKAARAQVLTASGGIIGALCALTANSIQEAGDMTAWILPFTAGGFIYIALVTCIPDLLMEKNPLESVKQVLLLCSGIAVMALVTLFS